jgi:ribosome-associated translation inhibitor RaiA
VQFQTEITFKGIDHSDALEARIRECANKLERGNRLVSHCEVVVESPHRHQRHGRQWHVTIRMTVPGGELVVTRDPGAGEDHEDPYLAVRDSFRVARRRLEQTVDRRRDAALGA